MWQLVVIFLVSCLVAHSSAQYLPNWESLDARPLPQWYDEAKIGIFIHWGVFSVPSYLSEWFWYDWATGDANAVNFMKKNYRQDFTYADFGPMFTAEFYNSDQWADIFRDSGAKYIVLTSKHHEGFTNWPSKVSFNWNSMDIGPRRDLVGELANSIRKRTKLHFGLYHSLFEWFNPMWLADGSSGFKTNTFAKTKTLPELYEIVNTYHPDVIWSDGDGNAPADKYWNSTGFLAWLYNESPVKDTVVTNDRWGGGTMCAHGGFYTCTDHYNPGHLLKHKWENCMTIDRGSWGYRRNAGSRDYLTTTELVHEVVTTVSCGGNILINVGPTSYGMISPIFEDRLRGLGSWLNVNGEAIYASKPWTHQNDTVTSYVWYTSKTTNTDTSVYAISLQWPKDGALVLGAVNATIGKTTVRMLGYGSNLNWISRAPDSGILVNVPAIPADKMPCQGGWVFKIEKFV